VPNGSHRVCLPGLTLFLCSSILPGCMVEQVSTPLGVAAPSTRVEVLAPSGGEDWTEGELREIQWVTSGPVGPWVGIDLLREDELCSVIVPETENDGCFEWTCLPCTADSAAYRIRVTDLATGAWDESEKPFAVTVLDEICQVEIVAPAEDLIWTEGDTLEIRWRLVGGACCAAIVIDLLYDDEYVLTLAEEAPNIGFYDWCVVAAAGEGSEYGIRLTDLETGSTSTTPEPLTFLQRIEPCELNLIYPNGGESLACHQPTRIEWDSNGACDGDLRLSLLLDGEVCATISGAVPNSGSFDWMVERCGEAAEGYRIRIEDIASGLSDESDQDFAIVCGCVQEFLAPAGGELWLAGASQEIRWRAGEGCGDWVNLDLLYDGAYCATVAEHIVNDGSHLWTVAAGAGFGPGYSLRLSDPASGDGIDSGIFTIEGPCGITVTSPAGGEQWQEGMAQPIPAPV